MAKRIRPARHYQRKDDVVRRIATAGKPLVAKDMHEAFKSLRALIPANLAELIRDGRLNAIHDAINWNHYREVLKKPFGRIGKVYEAAALTGVRKINSAFARARKPVRYRKEDTLAEMFDKAAGDTFSFDMYDAATQQRLRDAQDALIQQLSGDARDTVEQVILMGAQEGLGAADIVDNIYAVIGLTDTQAQAVMNYQQMLSDLDPGALARQLRNATMDQTVQDAIDSGELIPQDIIDQLTSDYADNYLAYRAATIAQTESVRAANWGLHDAYSQAIDRGAMPAEAVKREWQLGDSPCPICESIPDNNPDGVGVDEQFDSDEGPVDDPPIHPNACFAGTSFRAYGSLRQLARAPYNGPALTIQAERIDDGWQAAARDSSSAEYLDSADVVSEQLGGRSDLLVRNIRRTTASVIPSVINLTIGPNHPILTRRGFVPARELQEGDELLYDVRAQSSIGAGEIDFKEMVRFEDAFAANANVFKTVSPAGPRSYFHGDEVFTYGEVEIVFPERDLLPVWDSGGIEHLCECPLMGAYANAQHVATCSTCFQLFDRVFLAAQGSMGGANNSLPFSFAKSLPSFFHSFRIISRHWGMFSGFAFDASTSHAIYNAGGLVVKNCMCSVDYVTDISLLPEDDSSANDWGNVDTASNIEEFQ